MVVLFVLLGALVIFRGLGFAGFDPTSTWQGAAAWALAAMFLFTASAHFFAKTKEDFVAMVPKALPHPRLLVHLTGALEVLGAIGLLVPAARSLAGLCLVLLLVAMFPANVNAAIKEVPMRGRPPTPLWLRLPMQLIFVGLTWWATQV